MFKFITVLTVIGLCYGSPLPENPDIEIMKLEAENGADGAYNFLYEGSDGSFREEKAVPMNVGEEDEHLAVTGSYKYISADGKEIEVHYTADTRGFIITGQTIRDVSASRQPKSIKSSEVPTSKNTSENLKNTISETSNKSLPDTPNKSLPETPNETTKKSDNETKSEISTESANVSSTEKS